jgi:alanine racemase
MNHWIEISKSALIHNAQQIKAIVPNKKIGFVLKSNAYGHGLEIVASIINQYSLADYIYVSSLEEALIARSIIEKKKIVILSEIIDKELLECCYHHNISLIVYSIDALKRIHEYMKQQPYSITIHLKFETGMNRLGFLENDIDDIIFLISQNIIIEGICTHCAESTLYNVDLINTQKIAFNRIVNRLKKIFPYVLTHVVSSGGIDIENEYDSFRAGSALYGLWKSHDQKKRVQEKYTIDYKSLMTYKSRILQIKNIPAGSPVGYGEQMKVFRNSKIAILPLGYFHGYSRLLSHKSGVIINNTYAPLCGLVSMNMITVDVTDVPNITLDSIVTLISPDYNTITIDTLAQYINVPGITFSTGLSHVIPRIIVD